MGGQEGTICRCGYERATSTVRNSRPLINSRASAVVPVSWRVRALRFFPNEDEVEWRAIVR
jgi:hypothetical protein